MSCNYTRCKIVMNTSRVMLVIELNLQNSALPKELYSVYLTSHIRNFRSVNYVILTKILLKNFALAFQRALC
jgi:hypothetical protein